MGLPAEDLETLWETLAQVIDAAGKRDKVFLAKLVLLLAEEVGDRDRIAELIRVAQADL